jgi:hypothetical protein
MKRNRNTDAKRARQQARAARALRKAARRECKLKAKKYPTREQTWLRPDH